MTKNAKISRTKRKKLQACQKVANEMEVPLALSLLKKCVEPRNASFSLFSFAFFVFYASGAEETTRSEDVAC